MTKRSHMFKRGAVFLILIWLFSALSAVRAGFDEDPVKATQSKVVPVTKELLEQEGESGPASPTYKMSDTSGFLVKKPYDEAEEYDLTEPLGGFAEKNWDDWLSWEEDEQTEPSEVVDKK